MLELTVGVNWPAVALGTVLAFGLGMLWFSPRMFGKGWSLGSHNLQPPATLPLAALLAQLIGTALMAWIIGVTMVANAVAPAILIILAIAVLQLAAGLFGQKTRYAALVDAGYVVAMGALMLLAQAIL